MTRVLLDTNVIIDLLRTGRGVLTQINELVKSGQLKVYISTMTILELRTGEVSPAQEKLLADVLENVTIISLDAPLAEYAGKIKKRIGKSVLLADLIIGATSLYLKAEIVTGNRRHFEPIPGIKFYS